MNKIPGCLSTRKYIIHYWTKKKKEEELKVQRKKRTPEGAGSSWKKRKEWREGDVVGERRQREERGTTTDLSLTLKSKGFTHILANYEITKYGATNPFMDRHQYIWCAVFFINLIAPFLYLFLTFCLWMVILTRSWEYKENPLELPFNSVLCHFLSIFLFFYDTSCLYHHILCLFYHCFRQILICD